MAKFERILSCFPAYYAAMDRTRLLYEVVRLLAQPLEEADAHLFRIQRSHRLKVAEQAEDIIRLLAALNLTAFHFEDILNGKDLDYSQKLDLMRERIQRIARLHLRGLGTPWAIMESAAIFLNAAIVPEHPGDPLIKHLDTELSTHKAVIEFIHLPVPEELRERIYLYENPYCRKKIEPSERWQMNSWAIENKNTESSQVKLVIEGAGDYTILPSIFCLDTEEGILFNGIIPDGKMLVIDETNGAMLDHRPVDEWVLYFNGGILDFSSLNGTNFVQEQGDIATPFDGKFENITAIPFYKKKKVPAAPVGRSEWCFKVTEGIYNGTNYDFSGYATHPEPIGVFDGDFSFDGCVFDFPARGVVGMAWDEHIPCSFKLLLPSIGPRQPVNYTGRIGNIMPRFKAAGIQAFVDTAPDTWILGVSVIRSMTSVEEEGIEFHSTRLQNQKADMFVPLETTA